MGDRDAIRGQGCRTRRRGPAAVSDTVGGREREAILSLKCYTLNQLQRDGCYKQSHLLGKRRLSSDGLMETGGSRRSGGGRQGMEGWVVSQVRTWALSRVGSRKMRGRSHRHSADSIVRVQVLIADSGLVGWVVIYR